MGRAARTTTGAISDDVGAGALVRTEMAILRRHRRTHRGVPPASGAAGVALRAAAAAAVARARTASSIEPSSSIVSGAPESVVGCASDCRAGGGFAGVSVRAEFAERDTTTLAGTGDEPDGVKVRVGAARPGTCAPAGGTGPAWGRCGSWILGSDIEEPISDGQHTLELRVFDHRGLCAGRGRYCAKRHPTQEEPIWDCG